MATSASDGDLTRDPLWSHAAFQVASMPRFRGYECAPVGEGWGLRDPASPGCAVILHPDTRDGGGELALTLPGLATRAIPRGGASYIEYLNIVADALRRAAQEYLRLPAAVGGGRARWP